MLRSLRQCLGAQCQGHHTISLHEKGVEKGSARSYSPKGRERAIINQTNIGIASKTTSDKLLRVKVEHITLWAFSKCTDTSLK